MLPIMKVLLFSLFKKILSFLERGEGREKESESDIDVWERDIDLLPLTRPQTGDLAGSPDKCPGRQLNLRPFSLQAGTQSTEPHRPGQVLAFSSS